MKYVKDPKPLAADEIPGVKRVVALIAEELTSSMNRKRRSILGHTRRFFLAMLPEEFVEPLTPDEIAVVGDPEIEPVVSEHAAD